MKNVNIKYTEKNMDIVFARIRDDINNKNYSLKVLLQYFNDAYERKADPDKKPPSVSSFRNRIDDETLDLYPLFGLNDFEIMVCFLGFKSIDVNDLDLDT